MRLRCHHSPGFPAWADDSFSIFQNVWGEQWIAAWRGADVVISGGDIDWTEIVIGDADLVKWHLSKGADVPPVLMRTIFNDEERLWLQAVLSMAGNVASMRVQNTVDAEGKA